MSAIILTSDQVAELLYCSARSVEDHARVGTIPGVKIGEGWIFVSDMVIDAVRILAREEADKRKAPKPKFDPIVVANTAKTKRVPAGMESLSAEARAKILSSKAGVVEVHVH